MAPTYDVAIVGCGQIAGGYDQEGGAGSGVFTHAGAYRAHGGFALASCVDPDTEARRRFQRAWDIPRGYDTLADWIAAGERADIVSLCAPTSQHAALLSQLATAATRMVWAEKPLTGNALSSAALIGRFGAAAAPIAVNYLRRWQPEIAALIAAGPDARGKIQSISITYGKGLQNNAGHFLDLALALLGPLDPVAVGRVTPGFDAGDPTIDALLVARCGTPVHLVGADHRRFKMLEMRIVTTAEVLTFEAAGFRLRRQGVCDDPVFAGFRTLDCGASEPTRIGEAMPLAAANLHDHLSHGRPLACTAGHALAVERLCARLQAQAAACRRGA